MRVLGVVLLFAAVFGGTYFMSLFGPQKIGSQPRVSRTAVTEQVSALEVTSAKLREQFGQNVSLRAANKEDFAMLEEALAAEAEILRLSSGHNTAALERIEQLRRLYDEHHARALFEESQQAQIQVADADGSEAALRLMRKALELQEQINRDYSRSDKVNLLRAVRLKRELDHMEAKPLYESSLAAEQASKAAQESGDWTQAVAELEKALQQQEQLNGSYRGLSYNSPQRLRFLREQLDSLRASDLREQMQRLEAGIKEASEQGEHSQLAASIDHLIRLQETINRDFPSSRFASTDALKDYLGRREEARSRGMAQLILQQAREVDALLRGRNAWKAAEIIGSLSVQIDSFTQAFPESSLLGDELVQKYRFLLLVRNEIGPLQDKLYSQLLPVPGQDSLRMLRTEVPQGLYESVMAGVNPSRNRDPLLPVDSVNHDEATEFSRRVGWLLGLPARLPTQEEFRQALGRDRYARLADQTWNVSNAGGVTHKIGTREPNGNGFHDLLGNVSEWLLSAETIRSREASQIGGSIENTVDQLVDVPTQIVNALGRNRHNGFRIVVDAKTLPADSE